MVTIADRLMEGHWVLGMVAQNLADLRLDLCSYNKRDAATLVENIKDDVEEQRKGILEYIMFPMMSF